MAGWLAGWLASWLSGWMVGWLAGPPAGWLAGSLAGLLRVGPASCLRRFGFGGFCRRVAVLKNLGFFSGLEIQFFFSRVWLFWGFFFFSGV